MEICFGKTKNRNQDNETTQLYRVNEIIPENFELSDLKLECLPDEISICTENNNEYIELSFKDREELSDFIRKLLDLESQLDTYKPQLIDFVPVENNE
jgi:hypothetical protein